MSPKSRSEQASNPACLHQTSPANLKAVDSCLPATSVDLEEPKDSNQFYDFIYFNLISPTIVHISDIIV